MSEVGFCTAISFEGQRPSWMEWSLEMVDNYFYLGGKKGYVISERLEQGSHGVVLLTKNPQSCLIIALKVISYFTIVLPVILFFLKLILRCVYTFHIINDSKNNTLVSGLEIPLSGNEISQPSDAERDETPQQQTNSTCSEISQPADVERDEITQQRTNSTSEISQPADTERDETTQQRTNSTSEISQPADAERDEAPQQYSKPEVPAIVSNTQQSCNKEVDTEILARARRLLEEGIHIQPTFMNQIKELMPQIQARAEHPEIIWCNANSLVFKIRSIPGIVFKMSDPKFANRVCTVLERVENMVFAKAVCIVEELDRLVIPGAKIITINGVNIIAEEEININNNEIVQEGLYQLSDLDETVRQATVLICKIALSDIKPENMPIVIESSNNNRRFAFVDLEERWGAKLGMSGGNHRQIGFIGCLHSEKHIDIAFRQAASLGIILDEDAKTKRMQELEENQKLLTYYAERGILTDARKSIQVDIESLGLNLDEKGDYGLPATLKEAVVYIIEQINKAIMNTSETASLKGKRNILLSPEHDPKLRHYKSNGIPDSLCISKEDMEQEWVLRTIRALVGKGYLFKLVKTNNYGYFIQA